MNSRPPAPPPPCWVRALARLPNGSARNLGEAFKPSPRLALRWLRTRASDISDQLDPPAAHQLRAWSGNAASHEHVLALLARGRSYSYAVIEDGTWYVLLAGPHVSSSTDIR